MLIWDTNGTDALGAASVITNFPPSENRTLPVASFSVQLLLCYNYILEAAISATGRITTSLSSDCSLLLDGWKADLLGCHSVMTGFLVRLNMDGIRAFPASRLSTEELPQQLVVCYAALSQATPFRSSAGSPSLASRYRHTSCILPFLFATSFERTLRRLGLVI